MILFFEMTRILSKIELLFVAKPACWLRRQLGSKDQRQLAVLRELQLKT